jgi:hypothetical protein
MLPLQFRYRVLAFGAVTAVALGGVILVAVAGSSGSAQKSPASSAVSAARAGLNGRFNSLALARTNRCTLQPSGLDSMAPGTRLQGSCCSRMDFTSYVAQRRGLSVYRRFPQVPRDPYDVTISLARTLVRYNAIALTPVQQRTYRSAVAKSREKGPCCCRCWRWAAFEGQAKYFIAKRRFEAAAVARVWGMEDGCGGRAVS